MKIFKFRFYRKMKINTHQSQSVCLWKLLVFNNLWKISRKIHTHTRELQIFSRRIILQLSWRMKWKKIIGFFSMKIWRHQSQIFENMNTSLKSSLIRNQQKGKLKFIINNWPTSLIDMMLLYYLKNIMC